VGKTSQTWEKNKLAGNMKVNVAKCGERRGATKKKKKEKGGVWGPMDQRPKGKGRVVVVPWKRKRVPGVSKGKTGGGRGGGTRRGCENKNEPRNHRGP